MQSMLRGERNSPITMIFRRGAGGSGEQIVVTLLRAVAGGGRGPAPVAGGGEVKSPTASFSTQDASVLQSMTGLKGEFSNLSFLWGEPISDAVQDNMSDWKLNMLYGPKRDIPAEPLPIPAGLMPEALSINDSHLGMRRSFNSAAPVPMQSMANIPMYRSFDQGASLASFPRYDMPRFQSGAQLDESSLRMMRGMQGSMSGILGMPGMSAASQYTTGTIPSMSRPMNYASRPGAVQMGGMMTASDKNEMVC